MKYEYMSSLFTSSYSYSLELPCRRDGGKRGGAHGVRFRLIARLSKRAARIRREDEGGEARVLICSPDDHLVKESVSVCQGFVRPPASPGSSPRLIVRSEKTTIRVEKNVMQSVLQALKSSKRFLHPIYPSNHDHFHTLVQSSPPRPVRVFFALHPKPLARPAHIEDSMFQVQSFHPFRFSLLDPTYPPMGR